MEIDISLTCIRKIQIHEKHSTFSLLCCDNNIYKNSDAQNFDWAYTTAKPSLTQAISIRKDQANNFYLASQRDSSVNHLSSEIEKRDDAQALLWNKVFPGDVIISDLELTSTDHAVIIGYYMDSLEIDGTTIHSGIFLTVVSFVNLIKPELYSGLMMSILSKTISVLTIFTLHKTETCISLLK